ncbi:hypothetical protein LINPERPRIM_LOCUS37454 [Linum perenne]
MSKIKIDFCCSVLYLLGLSHDRTVSPRARALKSRCRSESYDAVAICLLSPSIRVPIDSPLKSPTRRDAANGQSEELDLGNQAAADVGSGTPSIIGRAKSNNTVFLNGKGF